jgi:hypothetical protein
MIREIVAYFFGKSRERIDLELRHAQKIKELQDTLNKLLAENKQLERDIEWLEAEKEMYHRALEKRNSDLAKPF